MHAHPHSEIGALLGSAAVPLVRLKNGQLLR